MDSHHRPARSSVRVPAMRGVKRARSDAGRPPLMPLAARASGMPAGVRAAEVARRRSATVDEHEELSGHGTSAGERRRRRAGWTEEHAVVWKRDDAAVIDLEIDALVVV